MFFTPSSSPIQWIESAGGRVIPIFADETQDSLDTKLSQINGILLTGGTEDLINHLPYYSTIEYMLSYLRRFNKKHDSTQSIPLWATCLGFQAMVCATSGLSCPKTIVDGFTAANIPLTIKWNENKTLLNEYGIINNEYSKSISMYDKCSKENITFNDHSQGFYPSQFISIPYLNENFTVFGTSFDRNGTEFVAFIQTKKKYNLNWFGTQFHPEKTSFLFDNKEDIGVLPHSLNSIMVNQYFAQYFVNQCRTQNNNTMNHSYYVDHVIYNYKRYFINQNGTSSYESVYLFNRSDAAML